MSFSFFHHLFSNIHLISSSFSHLLSILSALSSQLSPALPLDDNDNDHSISKLSVHTALTCTEGQRAWALLPSLFGECSHHAKRIVLVFPVQASCEADGEMCLTHVEDCGWSTVCCVAGLLLLSPLHFSLSTPIDYEDRTRDTHMPWQTWRREHPPLL